LTSAGNSASGKQNTKQKNMKLIPHKHRWISNLLHQAAMLPFMPLRIARKMASASARFYYQQA
jgi:hypothetical protein